MTTINDLARDFKMQPHEVRAYLALGDAHDDDAPIGSFDGWTETEARHVLGLDPTGSADPEPAALRWPDPNLPVCGACRERLRLNNSRVWVSIAEPRAEHYLNVCSATEAGSGAHVPATHVWADGYGTWHARIPAGTENPGAVARDLITEELRVRGSAHFDYAPVMHQAVVTNEYTEWAEA